MKANELRIGNWVELNQTGETTYTTIQPSSFSVKPEIYFKPIPLTEDWLEKFGFELGKVKVGLPAFKHPDLEMTLVFYDGSFGIAGAKKQPPLDYVHQLQNLYFALTGEELTIKQLV